MQPPGRELENSADNNCWACGPTHPIGLRLRFFDDGDTVRAPLLLDDRWTGGSRRVLQGVLYAAMDDVTWWTYYARFGELGWLDERVEAWWPGSVEIERPAVVAARVVGREDPWVVMEATVEQDGRMAARQRQRLRPCTRAEIEAWLARPDTVESLREDLRAALARRA